jgi:uncharacterized membrane protein HdeD (DUF308 family)
MSTDTNFGRSGTDASANRHSPVAQGWWLMALRGVAGIVFGLIALFAPFATILSLLFLFAIYMLVDGVFGIGSAIMAARRGERWALQLLEGLADIAMAAIAVFWPAITVFAFVLLLAAWAIISGGLMVGASFKDKRRGWGWWAFSGALSILFGIVLAIAPFVGAVVLTWWLGAYALVFGVILLVYGFGLRRATT